MFKKMYQPEKVDKIRLLVEGWFNIPHSYALVACNEILALERNFGDKLDIYISEQDYYREAWNDTKKLTFLPKKNKGIETLKTWKGEPIDVIYRITYPYCVTNKRYSKYNNKYIPTIVFYTAEFAYLDPSYFVFDKNLKFIDENFIKSFLEQNKCYHFKTPSEWSSKGMSQFVTQDRNKVITHGADTSVFYRDTTCRRKLRQDWGFGENDLVLMTGGALTRNKGVPEVLVLLYLLVFKDNKKNVKLVLKGTGELYPSQQMVEQYIDDLVDQKVMTRESATYLVTNHIKYLPKTVSEMSLRHLFNAVDVYISPYLAEGFNLMVLEAISCGTKVLVSKGGCTDDYTTKVLQGVPDAEDYIFRFDTQETGETKKHLTIDVFKLYNEFNRIDFSKQSKEYFNVVTKYVCDHLSWNAVSRQFFELIQGVYNDTV